MSKFSKNNNFKTKKQESVTLKKDVSNSKQTATLKKQNVVASSTTKTSMHGRETSNANDEKGRQKAKLKVEPSNKLNELKTTNKLGFRNTGTSKAVEKTQPVLRAKQTSNLSETLKKNSTSKLRVSSVASKKHNAVLDTPHNVTVSSPPQKRNNTVSNNVKTSNTVPTEVKYRKNSRTLASDEIVILKRDTNNIPIDKAAHFENITVKDPVAFEVKFEEKPKVPRPAASNVGAISNTSCKNTVILSESNEVEQNYADDFETYESDFETESSTQSTATSDRSSTGSSDDVSKECSETISQDTQGQSAIEDSEEESELTQNPVTVIQQANERTLDSGHYEMNSRQSNTQKFSDTSNSLQHLMDSIESSSIGLTDQLDSGISAYEVTAFPVPCNDRTKEIVFGGYKNFNSKPILNQRGLDLMLKIQFDVLSFTLLDLKPISYDVFMQTFGKLNTQQCLTQTHDNRMDTEQQTDLHETSTKWTQYPVQYDENSVNNQICCGEAISETDDLMTTECKLEQSLEALKAHNKQNSKHVERIFRKYQRKPLDYEHLNSFLLQTSVILNQILSPPNNTSSFSLQNTKSDQNQMLARISNKFYYLETTFLNTLKVVKIFSNNKYNLLITVHESLPDSNVYSSDFTNLLMVWSINITEKPLRLLTTWSQVSNIEISNYSSDVIMAALRDGSIALWDLRETYSFCSKLDGHLTHFAATQSIIPSLPHDIKTKSELAIDLGSCLDIKSFKTQHNTLQVKTKFPETQVVSLHDSGVLTVWTLIQTSDANVGHAAQTINIEKSKCSAKTRQSFEFISPWAQIKLVQSTIFNVKDYLETNSQHTQTRFDKTKTLFQKNIYSDEILKELNPTAIDNGQKGLRFTSLECGSNNLFVCTNRNFILMCSKTLKMEKLKRIMINESRFLFPTAIKVLNNENFLAVGLSNGAVIILNCQSRKLIQNRELMKTPKSPNKDSLCKLNTNTEITGKSCAIQNIVLNSQKAYEDINLNQQQYRPNTAAFVSLIESKRQPFELRVLDQQIIMNGTVLRKNLIQILELSSDGWRLFALTNGHIRVYDFYLDQEIAYQEIQEAGNIIDIGTGNCGNNTLSLIILKPNTQVEVYILNK